MKVRKLLLDPTRAQQRITLEIEGSKEEIDLVVATLGWVRRAANQNIDAARAAVHALRAAEESP